MQTRGYPFYSLDCILSLSILLKNIKNRTSHKGKDNIINNIDEEYALANSLEVLF